MDGNWHIKERGGCKKITKLKTAEIEQSLEKDGNNIHY